MVGLFHLLADGGKIPPYLCRWNFPPLADGGIFPPACIWWKNSTLLVGIFPPSASRWKFFSTICKLVEKFHHQQAVENTTYRGMVEFFHHQQGGGKVQPWYIHLFWWNFSPSTSRWNNIALSRQAFVNNWSAFCKYCGVVCTSMSLSYQQSISYKITIWTKNIGEM